MKRSYVHWYTARVKYRSEKIIKQFLETRGIEHYIPMQDENPLIPCLIFIRTDYKQALSLPAESGCMISYLCNPGTEQFRTVPDKQMEYLMILQQYVEKTLVLPHPEMLQGGRKVRVTKGEFAGIEGELYRIQGHKRVVVRLGGLISVATSYVPKEYLEEI